VVTAEDKLRQELEDALEMAMNDLLIADYAEDTNKMLREKENARVRIANITKRLEELEDESA
jgi:hypothetical protein